MSSVGNAIPKPVWPTGNGSFCTDYLAFVVTMQMLNLLSNASLFYIIIYTAEAKGHHLSFTNSQVFHCE